MIESINIEVSASCNLTCPHCFVANRDSVPYNRKSSIQSFEANMTDIINSDIKQVVFTGGEPTLFPQLSEYILKLSRKNITVLTNGIIRLDSFCKVDNIVVSLDGNDEVMQVMRLVTKAQLNCIRANLVYYKNAIESVRINTVVSKSTVKDMYATLEYIADEYAIPTTVAIIDSVGSELAQTDYMKILSAIEEIQKTYHYHFDLTHSVFSKARFCDTYSEYNPISFPIEYRKDSNCFFSYGKSYNTLSELVFHYEADRLDATERIIKVIAEESSSHLFNPYVLYLKILRSEAL